jgi:hypothetical protein
VIRQAISCDICGAEKRQTNHWFVAWEHDGELRVTGWSARTRLRGGAKHLCGQVCLHKLADDFMERIISRRAQAGANDEQERRITASNDTSLIGANAGDEFESSARLISAPITAPSVPRPAATLIPMTARALPESVTPSQDPPRYASRTWHAEAWQRERERNQQAPDRRPEGLARRISKS